MKEFEKNEDLKIKTYLVFFFICIGFLGVLLRVGFLQFIKKDELIKYSEKQFIRKTKVYPNRGQILDRHENPLAINVNRFNVFVMPQEIEDKKETSKLIGKVLKNKSEFSIYESIKDREKFTWVTRNIDLTEKQVKEIKKLKGVYTEAFTGRFYPNNDLASQIVGFVDVDNIGRNGIERKFNKSLKGKEKTISYVRDAKGRAIKFENLTQSHEPKDIVLSIDKEVQDVLETALKKAHKKHKADVSGAAVMDARTGEILAMANYPSFDPNKPGRSDAKNRKLSFLTDPFEPGSILKPLTVVAGLTSKIIEPDSIFYCENGKMDIGKYTIKESDGHNFKWLSVTDIIAESSNIGTSKIAFEVGFENIVDTFKKFGLGNKTNIELPYESRGIFDTPKRMKKIRLSNLSFGHGIAVSGMQVMNLFAPFANGGYKVRPTILKADNNPASIPIMNKETVNTVNKMLLKAVNEGTGKSAKINGFNIAGKTGTAQKLNKEEGGYSTEEFVSSFVGYPLNVKKPFVVFVYIDNPKENGHYGSEVAAPTFRKISESLLLKNKEFDNIKETLANLDDLKEEDEISFISSSIRRIKKNKVPNFLGLDRKSVLSLAEKTNFKVKLNGYGIVDKQNPKAFSIVPKDKTIKIILRKPQYD